jgi:2-aminoadipate transaminase
MSTRIVPAGWARHLEPSALQRMLETAAAPDVLSLSLGLPAVELFPREACARAASDVLDRVRTLQYGLPSAPLKSQIVQLMRARGVDCVEDEIFLTSGAQQGLQLLARLLVEPGGRVATDGLTYTGFLQAVRPLAPRILTVPVSADTGPDLDALEARLASGERPALLYAMPDGHNPLGTSLAAATRVRLVALAARYRLPIVEDGAYSWLQYGDAWPAPLAALDRGQVLYVGSFSKVLGPAYRVGWIVTPRHLVQPLSILKESIDINTATFSQHVINRYLDEGHFEEHLRQLRTAYRGRRDLMAAALTRRLPTGSRWRAPSCGFFTWVEVPGLDTTALLEQALAIGRVAFVPGAAFSADEVPRATSCLRLSFSNVPVDRIDDGIARIVSAMSYVRPRAERAAGARVATL